MTTFEQLESNPEDVLTLMGLAEGDIVRIVPYFVKLNETDGKRPVAVAYAAYLYMRKHGMFGALQEAVRLYFEVAEKIKQEKWRRLFQHHAVNINSWLAYSSNSADIPMAFLGGKPNRLFKRRSEWPIYPKHTTIDERASLGNILIWLAIYECDRNGGFDALSTTEHIGVAMAMKHLEEIAKELCPHTLTKEALEDDWKRKKFPEGVEK